MIYIDVLMIKCKINIYVGSHGVQHVNLFKFLFFHQCKILNPAVNLVQAQFKKSNKKKKQNKCSLFLRNKMCLGKFSKLNFNVSNLLS